MEMATELMLVPGARAEEAVDLEALVEEHQRMVYRIAYSLLRNHHDAEDAAQETFVRVWRAAGKLAQVDDRKAWVARIAWNAATDRLRKQPPPSVEMEALARSVRHGAAKGASAEEVAAGAEMQSLMGALVAGLPPKLRRVIELSTVEELDHAEIGRILGLPPPAVRTRLFEARRLLRDKLERLLGKQL